MISRHSMKAVARNTGLSPHLIRVWERRYRAVSPERTATGRRLYTDDDIAKLNLLKRATQKGEAIGQVAGLTTDELNQMMSLSPGGSSDRGFATVERKPALYLEEGLKVTRDLDSFALESILLDASASLGQQAFLDDVLMPLLEKTGELWESGDLKISQEHLASAVVRSLLGSMAMAQSSERNGPLLLTTTPAGQRHEFGALAAAVVAASMGWRTVHLGADLPAEEIASVVRKKGARAVAISLVYPGDDPRLGTELRKLRRLLPENVVVVVGGRSADQYADTLNEIEAVRTDGLADFRRRLNEIRKNPVT